MTVASELQSLMPGEGEEVISELIEFVVCLCHELDRDQSLLNSGFSELDQWAMDQGFNLGPLIEIIRRMSMSALPDTEQESFAAAWNNSVTCNASIREIGEMLSSEHPEALRLLLSTLQSILVERNEMASVAGGNNGVAIGVIGSFYALIFGGLYRAYRYVNSSSSGREAKEELARDDRAASSAAEQDGMRGEGGDGDGKTASSESPLTSDLESTQFYDANSEFPDDVVLDEEKSLDSGIRDGVSDANTDIDESASDLLV